MAQIRLAAVVVAAVLAARPRPQPDGAAAAGPRPGRGAGRLSARRRSTPSPTWPACGSARSRSSRATHVRTGVTAIVPTAANLFQDKVAAGVFVGNAFGKLAGSTQVEELGTIETPIVLTNTLGVGTAVGGGGGGDAGPAGQRGRALGQRAGGRDERRRPERHPRPARHAPSTCSPPSATRAGGPVAEGSVGAGTGTRRLRLEGRHRDVVARAARAAYGGYTLGVLVQANFGGVLTIDGVPVGKELGRYAFGPGSRARGPTATAPA